MYYWLLTTKPARSNNGQYVDLNEIRLALNLHCEDDAAPGVIMGYFDASTARGRRRVVICSGTKEMMKSCTTGLIPSLKDRPRRIGIGTVEVLMKQNPQLTAHALKKGFHEYCSALRESNEGEDY